MNGTLPGPLALSSDMQPPQHELQVLVPTRHHQYTITSIIDHTQAPPSCHLAPQAQKDVSRLPGNARLIRMPAICFWGMLGTLLESGAISQSLLQSFTHIVVASSFVRGPFLPVQLQVNLVWACSASSQCRASLKSWWHPPSSGGPSCPYNHR